MMMYNYCPICSTKLIDKEIHNEGVIPYCDSCNKLYFPFSYPCVIVLVKYNNKYILIKQKYVSDNYIVIAGHIKYNSTAEQTVIEEVKEEIGLDVIKYKYINSYYYSKRNNTMFGFVVEAIGEITLCKNEVDSYILVSEKEALTLLNESSIALNLLNDYLKSKSSE